MLCSAAPKREGFAASPVVIHELPPEAGTGLTGPRALLWLTYSETSITRSSPNSPSSTFWTESFESVVSPSSSKLQVPRTPS